MKKVLGRALHLLVVIGELCESSDAAGPLLLSDAAAVVMEMRVVMVKVVKVAVGTVVRRWVLAVQHCLRRAHLPFTTNAFPQTLASLSQHPYKRIRL